MRRYFSPEIQHMKAGAIGFGYARARGTLVFSPDDNTLGVLPVDFENPLNFGRQGAPPPLWNVDKGLALTTGQWNLGGRFAVNNAALSTLVVESWAISENREALTKVLEKGIKLEAVTLSRDGSQIATGHQNDIVKIHDTTTLNRTSAFEQPEN